MSKKETNTLHEKLGENDQNEPIQSSHKIIELNGNKVNTLLFEQGFVPGCDMTICHGQCCHAGVYMDKEFKKVILDHKDMIIDVMNDDQITDINRWFDEEIIEDSDFESGYAIGSNIYIDSKGKEKCVFNDQNQYCSLQVAAVKNGMHKWDIKPTHCILYPVTRVGGLITYDDEHSLDLDYCGMDKEENFVQSAFNATHEEIKYVFGEEVFNSMNEYSKANYSDKYQIKMDIIQK